jgi:outer membrane receptor protein involved in Fe transport
MISVGESGSVKRVNLQISAATALIMFWQAAAAAQSQPSAVNAGAVNPTTPQPEDQQPAVSPPSDAAAGPQAASAAPPASTEIVITAQKREQRLVDVPMAVSVVSGTELKQKGIESVQDLSYWVPGLTMREDGPGSDTIFLRGLANQSAPGALVTEYLDESPLSLSGYDQLSPVVLDLQRVEVLKGPQGTLYGQGSAGGTIRFITNKPKLDRTEGRVEGTLYDVADGAVGDKVVGIINLPVVEHQLAVRLAGSYESGGGWVDQPQAGIRNGNGTRLFQARGEALWNITDRLNSLTTVSYYNAWTKLGLGYEEPGHVVDVGIDRSEILIPKHIRYTLYNETLNYDLGFANLVSATSYVHYKHQYPFSYIPRPGNFSYGYTEGNDARYVRAHQFSQEARLTSAGKPLEWTLGAFYTNGRRTLTDYYSYMYAPGGDLYSGGPAAIYTDQYYFSMNGSKTLSFFGDATYHVTPRLSVDAGVRHFRDKESGLITYVPNSGDVQRGTFTSTDPRFSLTYKFTPHASFYVNVARGFRSGGFNSAPLPPFKPETIWSYEAGTKGSTAGGLLDFDVAAFLENYTNMIRRRLVLVNGQFASDLDNIGKVRVKGVEASLGLHPTSALTFYGNLAYLHSVIVSTDPNDAVNIVGDRVDYTPRWSYTLGANYSFRWSSSVPGFARIDFSHRDKVTYIDRSSFFPSALPQTSDNLNLLNARIGATINGVDVQLFGENLLNEDHSIDPYVGWANANRTRPRVIGIQVGHSF